MKKVEKGELERVVLLIRNNSALLANMVLNSMVAPAATEEKWQEAKLKESAAIGNSIETIRAALNKLNKGNGHIMMILLSLLNAEIERLKESFAPDSVWPTIESIYEEFSTTQKDISYEELEEFEASRHPSNANDEKHFGIAFDKAIDAFGVKKKFSKWSDLH